MRGEERRGETVEYLTWHNSVLMNIETYRELMYCIESSCIYHTSVLMNIETYRELMYIS